MLTVAIKYLKKKVLKIVDGLTDILAGLIKIINVFPTGSVITAKLELVEDWLEVFAKEIKKL